MQPGNFDRRIVIEYPVTTTDDDFGTQTTSWVALDGYETGSPSVAKTIAANIQDVLPSRGEGVRQGIELARGSSRLRIRYRTGITTAMRIREPALSDQIYNITTIPAMMGRKEYLEMMIEKYSTRGGV